MNNYKVKLSWAKIKAEMEAQGLNVWTLAKAAGVYQSTLRHIEQGWEVCLSPAWKIARALGVRIEDLQEGEDGKTGLL